MQSTNDKLNLSLHDALPILKISRKNGMRPQLQPHSKGQVRNLRWTACAPLVAAAPRVVGVFDRSALCSVLLGRATMPVTATLVRSLVRAMGDRRIALAVLFFACRPALTAT